LICKEYTTIWVWVVITYTSIESWAVYSEPIATEGWIRGCTKRGVCCTDTAIHVDVTFQNSIVRWVP